MDINQKDHAALRANVCPDCGRPVSFEEIGPWCKGCDVWFEFVSGWVMRNREANHFLALLKAAKKDSGSFNTENLENNKEHLEKYSHIAPRTSEYQATKELEQMTRSEIHEIIPAKLYLRHEYIPVSLYRWLYN